VAVDWNGAHQALLTKVAEPFFEWLATNAVQESKLNVENQSGWLLSRFKYFRGRFDEACAEAERRKNESHVRTETLADGTTVTIGESPYYGLTQNARWIGLAAIDAFYSWTEHLFIHLAILRGRATTGEQVVTLAEADWSVKFKAALDITDAATKGYFDKLVLIRRQLRNFIAHGAFGKQGEAFHFHSTAGAVPILLPRRPGKGRFTLTGEPAFDEHSALKAIDEFIVLLWSGPRAPARIYLEGASVPTILPMATDGTYAGAMRSVEEMQDFVDALSRSFDAAADMDW